MLMYYLYTLLFRPFLPCFALASANFNSLLKGVMFDSGQGCHKYYNFEHGHNCNQYLVSMQVKAIAV